MSNSADKELSDEELRQANAANRSFWQASQEFEEAAAAAAPGGHAEDDELYIPEPEDEDASSSDGTTSGGNEDEATTTDGGAPTDGDQPKKKRKKNKERRDRTPTVLSNVTEHFTEVTASGLPMMPEAVAKGYSMQLGCILRESVSINTKDIRSDGNKALRDILIQKLHQRYTFPQPFNKKVDSLAIQKMSTALSSWKFRVKKKIDKGLSWEKIKAKEPMLDKEEFDQFKSFLDSEEAKAWTKWGKQMRELNIGNHHCGSGGYRGKKPIWDKEDAEYARLGKENPWEKITDEQTRFFVRSRYYLDKKTGEFVTDDDAVKEFEKHLVSNLITADISKSN